MALRGRDEGRLPGQPVFDYWSEDIWRGPYSIDEEQSAETLPLLAELVNAI